jgi:phospholipid/cholesterol/gamma-HCH transport system substrate-binding protein
MRGLATPTFPDYFLRSFTFSRAVNMISQRPRNFIVGLTFLAALALCMYGIVLLGKFPFFGGIRQYTVRLTTTDANGVSTGSKVELNGVYIGQVQSTWLAEEKGAAVVNVLINVDPKIDIPTTASVVLQRPISVGNPYVAISAAEFKKPFLSREGTATLKAIPGESSLIPKDVTDSLANVSKKISTVADDLHVLLAYTPPEALEKADPKDPNAPKENASTVIIRLDRTIGSLQALLTDPKLQGQVRDTIQNISDASTKLRSALDKIDKTIDNANSTITSIGNAATSVGSAATQASATIQATEKDIHRVAQQLVETIAQLDKSVRDITEGKGTTGRLVSDPRLYEGLLDLSRSLKSTSDDLDFLIQKWKDEGVDLRLK